MARGWIARWVAVVDSRGPDAVANSRESPAASDRSLGLGQRELTHADWPHEGRAVREHMGERFDLSQPCEPWARGMQGLLLDMFLS